MTPFPVDIHIFPFWKYRTGISVTCYMANVVAIMVFSIGYAVI